MQENSGRERRKSHSTFVSYQCVAAESSSGPKGGRRDESLERVGSHVAGESDGSHARLSIIMRMMCIAPTLIRQATNIRARKGSQRVEFLQVCGYQKVGWQRSNWGEISRTEEVNFKRGM